MTEYELIKTEEGNIVPCYNCGYPAPLRKFNINVGGTFRDFLFCRVCSETFLSKASTYPRQCCDIGLFISIGWIANEILARIDNKKST